MASHFAQLFESWAPVYDSTIADRGGEYGEVFLGYRQILNQIAKEVPANTPGYVVDMGSGTGNLAHVLRLRGHQVIAVDPVQAMLDEARHKFPNLELATGDFLSYDYCQLPSVKAIVSSYAFHHLTDPEKEEALSHMKTALSAGGRIILADTVFKNEDAKAKAIQRAVEMGYHNLVNDLVTEYYTTITCFENIGKRLHLNWSSVRLNYYVWLLVADVNPPTLPINV